MRPLTTFVLAGWLTAFGLAAVPSPARAMAPAIFEPAPSWMIGITTKCVVRILEFVDWAVEDLRDQVDRRRRWDPTPPLLAPPLEAVASGGTTTATPWRARGGMIP